MKPRTILVKPHDFCKGISKEQLNTHHRKAKSNGGSHGTKNETKVLVYVHRAWELLIIDVFNGKPLTASSAVLQIIRVHICFEALFVVTDTNRVLSFEECVQMMNRFVNKGVRFVPVNGFKKVTLKVSRRKEHRKAFLNIFSNPKTCKKYDSETIAKKFCYYYSILQIFYKKPDGNFRTVSEVFDEVAGLLDDSFKLDPRRVERLRKKHVKILG